VRGNWPCQRSWPWGSQQGRSRWTRPYKCSGTPNRTST